MKQTIIPLEIMDIIQSFISEKCDMCNTKFNILTCIQWGSYFCCQSCINNLELLML